MTEWKQIYETIKIRREDSSIMESFMTQLEDASLLSYLNMVIDLDPSPRNKLRLELFKDFLKLLKKS
jgi:hypothetical protein